MSLNNSFNAIKAKLIKIHELWQHDLLTSQELLKFCNDRKVKIYDHKAIDSLWALGFLRADLIVSENKVDLEGLELVHVMQNQYFYLDNRRLQERSGGYGGSFSGIEPTQGVIPYFHPFRFYVLYHVERIFSQRITSTQFLSNPQGLIRLSELEIEYKTQFTSGGKICDLFDQWNRIAEASIILEPYSYERVYGLIKYSFPDTEETIKKKHIEYRSHIDKIINLDDRLIFEEYRQKLCCSAEDIDSNKSIHVLLRLTSWHRRNKIKDAIGGSLVLLSMAEIIRRPLEKALNIKLPEEDELGYGQWMAGGRQALYGTERVLDASKEEIKDFLVDAGLDFGIKVRCYLEGETEFGAIDYALGNIGSIQLIDLKGQFIEGRGKGLSFRASLENDLKAKIFSFVILDADREDFVRVVKSAAKDDILSGGFFLSSPDIEFDNFSLENLLEIVCKLCSKLKVDTLCRDKITEEAISAKTGNDFFKALKRVGIDKSVTKGKSWGAALMEYALENDIECQIVEAAKLIARASRVKFQYSRDRFSVNPETGKHVERNNKN